MPSVDVPDATDAALEFYKSQIRELEAELADFQASSRELEQELEKELEASEKQHRDLRTKNEGLRYEVDEWKSKYNKSKQEANSAQNTLQKEITTLREQNRTMQLRLRDMEVSNDDFERQERIVMSSLEDIESKYNHSIERSVMLEEEVRAGEQEREALRIEVQRLRDELSDLKVEQEITVEKLNNTMAMAAKYGNGSLHHVPPPKFHSPLSDTSTVLTEDSPSTPVTTPSVASTSTPQSDHSGPPSPPMSEISTTPSQSSRITSPLNDPATTPRPRNHQKPKKHVRNASLSGGTTLPMPSSRSLNQIRGLIGQMQRLEQRVQSARSKLPGPTATPPRVSPRTSQMPAPINLNTVTMRSHKKPRTPSIASSVTSGGEREGTPSYYSNRLSYSSMDRPASRAMARPESRAAESRPSSRASGATSQSSVSGGLDRVTSLPQRPQSRASMSGRVTPMGTYGDYDRSSAAGRERRSMGREEGGFGFVRRNTLNAGSSAIPLPRKSYGGRMSVAGTRGFTEEGSPTTTTSNGGRRLTPRRVGEK
ncbi:hypothetical protein BDD12DRAFT_804208 [Trichophaea hybrida]|nr:hypothetical protein BDD12DRAFT_804208 [Trichophaea hybrida]